MEDNLKLLFAEIRKQAEQRADNLAPPPPPSSTEEMQKLVHELEVRKIEIELYGESLRGAWREKDLCTSNLTNLIDHTPEGVFERDNDGIKERTRTSLTDAPEPPGASELNCQIDDDEGYRFRNILEIMPFPVSIISSKGEYEYLNPMFTRVFGYTCEDIPNGSTWFEKAYPDPAYRQKVLEYWVDDLTSSKSMQLRPRTFKVVCKSGAEKSILFRPATLSDGREFVIYEDISERLKIEAELISQSRALDQIQGLRCHYRS